MGAQHVSQFLKKANKITKTSRPIELSFWLKPSFCRFIGRARAEGICVQAKTTAQPVVYENDVENEGRKRLYRSKDTVQHCQEDSPRFCILSDLKKGSRGELNKCRTGHTCKLPFLPISPVVQVLSSFWGLFRTTPSIYSERYVTPGCSSGATDGGCSCSGLVLRRS